MARAGKFIFTIVTAVVVSMVAGCAASCPLGIDAVKSGAVETQTVVRGDDYAAIRDVSAYRDGGNLIICGKVERLKARPESYDAHIDFTVVGNDGTVLKSGTTGLPQFSVKRWTGEFSASLPATAGEGAFVRLAYHSHPAMSKQDSTCPGNAALVDPATVR